MAVALKTVVVDPERNLHGVAVKRIQRLEEGREVIYVGVAVAFAKRAKDATQMQWYRESRLQVVDGFAIVYPKALPSVLGTTERHIEYDAPQTAA